MITGLREILFPATSEGPASLTAIVRLDLRTVTLINRCANLFFFYQSEDPFQQLQMHDYGFFKYENFENFMSHAQSNVDLFNDHKYLKPVFRDRDQFLLYDTFTFIQSTILPEVVEMKIKQTSILGNCGTKICKVLLRHIGGTTGENLEGGPETRRLLLDTLDQLLTPFRFR